jgi:hypothetical protein
MKINRQRLKFARDSRFIDKAFKALFENFDITKLKLYKHGFSYDDKIFIQRWVGGAYDPGYFFELKINGESFPDEVTINWFRSLQRVGNLNNYYLKLCDLYDENESIWDENKERIREEFLCEMYKKRNNK